MNLQGLKINFLGDSITEGHGTSSPDKIYWALLGKETGATVRGYGIGGTRFAHQKNPSVWPRHDLDFIMRAETMDDDADVVVVFGGTNDYGHGDAPIGTPSDRDGNTFFGACHKLFSDLVNKYPSATIVVMTPLHRTGEDNPRGDCNKPHDYAPLSTYVKIIKDVAEYYSLPLLDLWSISGIQPNVEAIRAKYCPDGLHPNDAGHVLIKNRLVGFLKTL
ncbi:MAG: SGNH/GDSL hydrolase family protein [Clostridia bacterium]|nr:SGNH/GDSL hydrolase family protein [Clostridia bacterium]